MSKIFEMSLLAISDRSFDIEDIPSMGYRFVGRGMCVNIYNYLTKQEKDSILALIQDSANRGDIIHIIECGSYRNDGRMIYDGNQLLDLYVDIDDYGSVPPIFLVGDEFLATHWLNTIDHNSIVWIDPTKYRDQLIKNMKDNRTQFTSSLGTFTINIIDDDIGECISSFISQVNQDQPMQLIALADIGESGPSDPYVMYFIYY